MTDKSDILISVDNRHVQNMLNGTKTIELRRRPIRISRGSRVWIYSKVPIGEVCACGLVEMVVEDTPKVIWRDYGDVSGLSKDEFLDYFSNTEKACAIVFESIKPLSEAISLNDMRQIGQGFHPPQFFKFLYEGSPELMLLQKYQTAA